MRDDEDNIRQYLPVLRRIIILVAVLTAIPVVMWTITAFVRSHIGPPRAPDLRPMAIAPTTPPATATAATGVADQPAAQSADAAPAPSSRASAYAGTDDAAASPPAGAGGAAPADASPTGATPSFKTASVAPSTAPRDDATAGAPPPDASGSADSGAASPPDGAASDPSSDNGGTQVAARPQDSVWPSPPTAAAAADGMPAGEPISGPVPLPRKRPTSFAVAGNIPLPAPRPEAAGPGAPEAQPTPIDWLKKVFHSSAAPAPSSDGGDDTAHE